MKKITKVIEETVETSFDRLGRELNLSPDELWNTRLEDKQLLDLALKYDCSVNTVKLLVSLCNRINVTNQLLNEGINELEDTHVLDNAPFDRIGSPWKIAKLFGGREQYIKAINGMKDLIYAIAA